MLLKQMKYFVSVVDCKSFTEAAERNYISQSAVSQQIKQLEDEIGVPLLRRSKRRFVLTEAGKYLYEHGKNLLGDAERLLEETGKIGQSEGNARINIGYLRLYTGRELLAAIAQFRQKYPEVVIDIKAAGHEELCRGLLNGRIDFVLSNVLFGDESKGFKSIKAKERNVYVDIYGQDILAKKDFIEAEELQKMPCIIIADKQDRKKEAEFLTECFAGLKMKFIFAGDLNEARMLAAGGSGFIFTDGENFGPVSGMKRLPVYIKGQPLKGSYYLIARKEQLNECEDYLLELIMAEFNKTEK